MQKESKALKKSVRPWEYQEAVEITKTRYRDWHKATVGLVGELHAAQCALSNAGYRSDITSCQDGTRFPTFEKFLEDVGIPKRTAYNWLQLYLPEEGRLLTQDEYKTKKIFEFEELIKQLEGSTGKSIDWRPEGWSTACENYYKSKLKQKKLFAIAQRDSFDQAELFNREYLASLSDRFDVGSPEEILAFGELCEEVKPYAVKEVPVSKQARVIKLVEAALAEFQPTVRDKVARFVAESIIRREVK